MVRKLGSSKWLILALILFTFSMGVQAQKTFRTASGRINGQVRYPGGKPATEVLVSCDAWSGGVVGQVRTDARGNFVFENLGTAQFTISVRQPGFLPFSETVELATSPSAYVQINLRADPNAPAVTPASVVDSNVPIAAQKEFEKAEAAIASGKKENIAVAIGHYQQAVTLHPQFLKAQLKLGTAYMDLGQWDKAEAALKKTIAIDPKAVNAYFALGEVHRLQKKDDEAEKVLLQGLQIEDRSAAAHLSLSRVYWSMAGKIKDNVQARPTLEKAYEQVKKTIELDPKLAQARLLKGNLLLRVQRVADAQKEFEEYLRLEPKGPSADQARVTVDKLKKALESEPKP